MEQLSILKIYKLFIYLIVYTFNHYSILIKNDNKIKTIFEENNALFNELNEPNEIEFFNDDFLQLNWKDASILL